MQNNFCMLPCKLLCKNGEFLDKANTRYYYPKDKDLNIELPENTLWKPNELGWDDFKKLCELFGIQQCVVRPKPQVLCNDDVGKKAEECVYEHLKQKYGPDIQETPQGFTTQKVQRKVQVIWHRLYAERLEEQKKLQDANTHLCYECDFTIIGDGKKEKRIEVKGSRGITQTSGIFSKQELRLMMRAEKEQDLSYTIFHIRNIEAKDKKDYRWKKIKNITHVSSQIPPFQSEGHALTVTPKTVTLSFESIEDFVK